jgi:serine/threonine-protein kinase
MSARAPAQPGDVVAGKYVVKGVIGRGGVGVVVAADHKTLRCPVALKFLRPEIAYEPQVVQRFLREAHAAARLRSEHVARVMDAGSTDDGAAYLVMELLEGRDFAALLKDEGPLPVHTAVDYVVQACDAVAEAHALGIVHRDLKSANLFLTRRADGTPLVKVLDFGLSKLERSPSQPTLTADNHVMGSPHFMSPEQMRSSREADARSDIWSLGVVLYTLLAGRVPFEGTYLTEVCSAVLSGSPPTLTSLRSGVPAELAAVVDRCLRLEPEERFQTVAELVAALAPFAVAGAGATALAPTPPSVPPRAQAPIQPPIQVQKARRRVVHRGTTLIALGTVVVGAVVVLLIVRRPPADEATPIAASPLPAAVVTASPVEPPAAAPAASAAVPVAPALKGPVAPRRTTGSAPRRASAPAATAATAISSPPSVRSSQPKTEDDVILGLPH